MKTYHATTTEGIKVHYWYDRSIRCWTAIPISPEHFQIGDAQYCHARDTLAQTIEAAGASWNLYEKGTTT